LFENATDVGQEERGEQKNGLPLSESEFLVTQEP
jgi:hypothetical protein